MEFLAFQTPIIYRSLQEKENLVVEYGVDRSSTEADHAVSDPISESSVFLTGRGGGVVDTWDLRYQPTISSKPPNIPEDLKSSRRIEDFNILSNNSNTKLIDCSKEMKVEIRSKIEKEMSRNCIMKTDEVIDKDMEIEEPKYAMIDIGIAEKEFVEMVERDIVINQKGI